MIWFLLLLLGVFLWVVFVIGMMAISIISMLLLFFALGLGMMLNAEGFLDFLMGLGMLLAAVYGGAKFINFIEPTPVDSAGSPVKKVNDNPFDRTWW